MIYVLREKLDDEQLRTKKEDEEKGEEESLVKDEKGKSHPKTGPPAKRFPAFVLLKKTSLHANRMKIKASRDIRPRQRLIPHMKTKF